VTIPEQDEAQAALRVTAQMSARLAREVAELRPLKAEVKRLTARVKDLELSEDDAISDRDEYQKVLDEFAYRVAPESVIGEHSSGNDPWTNALELLTSAADVEKLKAERDTARGLLAGSQKELRAAVAAWGQAERERDEARAEVERLKAKLDGLCGDCHPCTNYAPQTWIEAGRKPPHVHEWDEARAALDRVRELREHYRACDDVIDGDLRAAELDTALDGDPS
jgi:DNA repair exonuclease SbcCD ATPase subunit